MENRIKASAFRKAYERLFGGWGGDIKKFVTEIKDAGFSTYWAINGREMSLAFSAIERSIKDRFELMGESCDRQKAKEIADNEFEMVRKMYNQEIGVIDIMDM